MKRKSRTDCVWNLEFTNCWCQTPRSASAGRDLWAFDPHWCWDQGRDPQAGVRSWAMVQGHCCKTCETVTYWLLYLSHTAASWSSNTSWITAIWAITINRCAVIWFPKQFNRRPRPSGQGDFPLASHLCSLYLVPVSLSQVHVIPAPILVMPHWQCYVSYK